MCAVLPNDAMDDEFHLLWKRHKFLPFLFVHVCVLLPQPRTGRKNKNKTKIKEKKTNLVNDYRKKKQKEIKN